MGGLLYMSTNSAPQMQRSIILRLKSILSDIAIRIADPLLATIITPFLYILFRARRRGLQHFPAIERALLAVGVFPIINTYYEPMFDNRALRSLRTDRNLPGLRMNLEQSRELIRQFDYSSEFSRALEHSTNQKSDVPSLSISNNSFGSGDADIWYAMIRHFKPKRIIEIGSGNSTLVARLAISANQNTEIGYSCQHTCVEPYSAHWLEKCGADVVRQPVELLPLTIFSALQENDILFIDSSHVIRPQGDVLFEYLEILPLLAQGVIVHIHDVFTPKDYLDEWVLTEKKLWNEQYLLEAFLSCNNSYQVLLPVNHLHHNVSFRQANLEKNSELGKVLNPGDRTRAPWPRVAGAVAEAGDR